MGTIAFLFFLKQSVRKVSQINFDKRNERH